MRPTLAPSLLVAILALPSFTMAQSLSLAAAAPVALSAQIGGSAQLSTLPAGPMPSVGQQSAAAVTFGGTTRVALEWLATEWATELSCEISVRCEGAGYLVGQSTAPVSDFLIALSAPSPMSVQILLEKEVAGVSWALVPVTRIDVGNDGTEELTEALVGSPAPVSITLGPVPLPVRCTVGAQLNGPGSLLGKVRLRVVPRDTLAASLVTGCSQDLLYALPRLDGGVQFAHFPVLADPAVLVLGLAPQPLLLGVNLGLPCLLLPRPDFVTLIQPGVPVVLPIPPAVRPVQVYAQSVSLGPFGITTSTGYWIQAF